MANTYPSYRIQNISGIEFAITSVVVGPGRVKHSSGLTLPDSVKLIGTPVVPAGAVLDTADGIPVDFHDTLPVYTDDLLALLVYANEIDSTKAWRQVLVGQTVPVKMAKVGGGVTGFKRAPDEEFAVLFLRLDTAGLQEQLFPCEETTEDLLGGITDLRSLFARPKKGKTTAGKPSFNVNAKAARAGDDDEDGGAPQSGLTKLFGK